MDIDVFINYQETGNSDGSVFSVDGDKMMVCNFVVPHDVDSHTVAVKMSAQNTLVLNFKKT